MRYTVVVDNFCSKSGLLAEWGYSAFLETAAGNLLLDTGGLGHVLQYNMKCLKIEPSAVQNLILSHSHHDHISGIWDLFFKNPRLNIFAGHGVEREKRGDADAMRRSGGIDIKTFPNGRVIEDFLEILPGVFAFVIPTGSRSSQYVCCRGLWEINEEGKIIPDRFEDDVSIAVKGDNGWSILLGCAHAGLPNILHRAKEIFDIDGFDTVVGGTHLCAALPDEYDLWFDELARYRVRRWRPNHCSSFKAAAALARRFEDVDWAGAGTVLEL